MVYKKKMVSVKKGDFEQLVIYTDQVLEVIDILQDRYSKNFNLEDFLNALKIHAEVLKKYKYKLIEDYNLNYILTLEKICNTLSEDD